MSAWHYIDYVVQQLCMYFTDYLNVLMIVSGLEFHSCSIQHKCPGLP